jgi:hemerythrin
MIEWDDKYSVGVSVIDKQHKKLIDIINKAITAKQHNNTTTQQHNNTTTQQHNNTTTQQQSGRDIGNIK